MLLSNIKSSVDVDLMPGEFDPANYTLPQQPLHKCMFPQASRYPTFQTVTNPYDFIVEGVRYLNYMLSRDNKVYSSLSYAHITMIAKDLYAPPWIWPGHIELISSVFHPAVCSLHFELSS
jgi:DNA polymerase delta subunit 2